MAADDPGPRRVWPIGLAWFVGLAVLGGAWALASPPFSGPDEPAHVTRAASLWSGHLAGADANREGRSIVEDVPDPLAQGDRIAHCFAFRPTESACDDEVEGADRLRDVVSTAGRYPPLYYALVGGPLRAWPSANGIYLSRMVGVVLAAAAIASAAALAQRRGPAPITAVGVLVAATPMTLFTSAVINPSGLEIAAAVLLWVACLQVAERGADRAALLAVAVSGVVLAQSRPISPAFVALIALVVLLAFGHRHLVDALRRWEGQATVAALVLAAAGTGWWVLAQDALELVPGGNDGEVSGFGEALGRTLHRVPLHLDQMIGWFGWLDVKAPSIVLTLWLAAVGLLVLAAVRDGSRRGLCTLAGLMVTVALAPPLLDARSYDELGVVWQGRYGLPLAVGIPLLAAHLADRGALAVGGRRALERRQLAAVAGVLAMCHVLAFWWALRRYVTGTDGPVIPDVEELWAPPIHAINLCLLAVVGAGLLAWAAIAQSAEGDPGS